MTKRPTMQGPEWTRRYSIPTEEGIEGRARVHYAAELDRCVILSPNGDVKIGAAHLSQCVIVGPCEIGDDVKAVAAILNGTIGDRVQIEAHADIMGTVEEGAVIRRGVIIKAGAFVGPDSEIGDNTVVHMNANIEGDVRVGAQSDIGEGSFVREGLRLPPRSLLRADSFAVAPSDTRMEPSEDAVAMRLIDVSGDGYDEDAVEHIGAGGNEDEDDDFDEEEDEENEQNEEEESAGSSVRPDDWEPPALGSGAVARPGQMAKGRARVELRDFHPGTARSWVLSKLARIANVRSKDGRISKKLVAEFRPDLLDHGVTKEVLRMAPPPTDQQLAEMSADALSPAAYDVYTGISFHAGNRPEWQMIGPKANDVFVFGVPARVWHEALQGVRPVLGDEYDEGRGGRIESESDLFRKTNWHPDKGVSRPIGWVRTMIYPKQVVVVVEIQSDREWMKFGWKPTPGADRHSWEMIAQRLRDIYFETFAADALNIVIEWAFANRYQEVQVLDHASRVKLGGHPPKSFYDDVPKKYTVSAVEPLVGVRTYSWVPDTLKVRRIIPNKRER